MRKTICRICSDGCGLIVKGTKKSFKIEGDPDQPISKGFTCPKSRKIQESFFGPDRLHSPLLKKKSGNWETLSWENALDFMARNLDDLAKRYGPESVVFFKGEAPKHQEAPLYMRHLANAFGSPNFINVDSLCHSTLLLSHHLSCGGIPYYDEKRHKAALVWGANPQASHPRLFSQLLQDRKERGLKLLVVDPVKTKIASLADIYWPINPGTDGFLALALSKISWEERPELFKNSDSGYEEWQNLLATFNLQDLLGPVGIQEKDLRQGLELLWAQSPVWVHPGVGLELQPHAFQSIRSIVNFSFLLDGEAQGARYRFPQKAMPRLGDYPQMKKPIGAEVLPYFTEFFRCGHMLKVPQAILEEKPYPLKGLFITGANPAVSFPDSQSYIKSFKGLDFMVVHDFFMTKTAQLADLVLPASSFLEFLELHDYGAMNKPYLGTINPVFSEEDIIGWPLWRIIFSLAEKLGLGSYFPWKNNEEAINYRLGNKLSAESFKTGEIFDKCVNYQDLVKPRTHERKFKVDLMDKYQLPTMPEPGTLSLDKIHCEYEGFPLKLITGNRKLMVHNTQLRDIQDDEPLKLLMSKKDMSEAGLSEDEMVNLSTPWGNLQARATLADIKEGSLSLPHGVTLHNANRLTSLAHLDPFTGFPWLKALPAKVEKLVY